jgi:uncharacterized protein (DUF2141 family)
MRLHTIALAALLPLGAIPAANAADLKITITGAGPTGRVMAKLFATADSFEKMNPAIAMLSLSPSDGQVSVTIGNLPPGRYAVAAFQDVKGTGKLESNLLGIPTEPYGFSNDAAGGMGPPGFDQAAFTIGADGGATTLHLR